MVEFDEGYLFVTAAGDGSCLSVLSGMEADVGRVAYEMTLLVHRVGEHWAWPPRAGLAVLTRRSDRAAVRPPTVVPAAVAASLICGNASYPQDSGTGVRRAR